VNQGLEDVKRGINATHILQEFILIGHLVGKGYSPEKAYETVEEWERTGESKLLLDFEVKLIHDFVSNCT
jgi:hypothetical protein